MSREDKNTRMPSSGSGLVSYASDYKSKISFKPQFIIVIAIVILLIEILLHLM
ncbi:MAG: preprotein translocase subunit Sec61beta [Candidatus Woesearchaeota archaeon]|jgi:preprotein translocase subunit Sec61beta